MSRIKIRKYRASDFAQLVEYARSVEPCVCSADETAAIEEAALDIARAGGYSFVEAKRALESVLNVVPPARYIALPKLYRHAEQISEHRRREWVDTNPENGELLLAFRQSKEDLIRMGVLK